MYRLSLERDRSGEKLVDDLREFLRARPQPQVSIVEDVELRMRDQAMHDFRVDEWNKWVVIPMHDQGRLSELWSQGRLVQPTPPSI